MLAIADLKIAIIGLGYVGLPLAVEFGKKVSVVGFDIHQKRIDELFGHYMIEVPCTQIKSSQIFDEEFNWKQYCL